MWLNHSMQQIYLIVWYFSYARSVAKQPCRTFGMSSCHLSTCTAISVCLRGCMSFVYLICVRMLTLPFLLLRIMERATHTGRCIYKFSFIHIYKYIYGAVNEKNEQHSTGMVQVSMCRVYNIVFSQIILLYYSDWYTFYIYIIQGAQRILEAFFRKIQISYYDQSRPLLITFFSTTIFDDKTKKNGFFLHFIKKINASNIHWTHCIQHK